MKQQKVALITGANAGIGLELTRKLLAEDWVVVALNRSDFPVGDERIVNAINNERLRVYKVADLTHFASLKEVLDEIKEKERYIDILFNNAGASLNELRYSKQGREMHYELMTVVPYIVLMELKELLSKGRLKTVINTSSSAIKMTKAFSIDVLERPKSFRKLIGPYATSKLALSLWSEAIAPQLNKEGIQIRSVDPGGNNTMRSGKKSGLPVVVMLLMKLFFPPPTHGANQLYEGAFGKHRHDTGVFLVKGQVRKLKFNEHGMSVLEKVTSIYKKEFLASAL